MTDILPWLAANWLMLAIALAFVIFLIAGMIWALAWYLHTWFAFTGRELRLRRIRDPMADAHGDVPHVPRNPSANSPSLHPTKGYGWASRRGKRANG